MNSRSSLLAARAIQFRICCSYANSSPRYAPRIPSFARSASNFTNRFRRDGDQKNDFEERKGGSYGDRKGAKDFGDRNGGRGFGDRKGGRDFGDRDGGKDFGDRKGGRDFGHLKWGKDFGDRNGGKDFGDRNGGRDFGDRKGGRDFGDRKGGRDFGDRNGGRDFGDRRGGRDFGDRKGGRDFGDRKGGRDFGDRNGGRDFGDRKGGRDFGDRNGGRDFGERRGGGNRDPDDRTLKMERRAFAEQIDRKPRKFVSHPEEEDADYTSLALPSARVRSFHPSSPRIDSAPPGQEYIREPRRYIQKVNEDAEWIYGSSVVEAALRSHAETNKRRKQLNRLYIYSGANRTPGNLDRDRQMQNLAKKVGVEVVWEKDVGKMDSMSNSRPHNGYVLEALPLEKTPVLSLEKVDTDKSTMRLRLAQHAPDDKIVINELSHEIACREPERRYPFVLMLDEILDPGNMGAMLRSAYYLGADAVVVSAKNCAPLSPVCLKASAGAAEFIPILEHAQGERFIKNSAENGWTFYAALPPQKDGQKKDGRYVLGSQVGEAVTKGPVVLVLGSEGEGLRQSLVKNVHYYISIDSAANTDKIVDSLNVSVASALLVSRFLQGN